MCACVHAYVSVYVCVKIKDCVLTKLHLDDIFYCHGLYTLELIVLIAHVIVDIGQPVA